MARMFCSSRSVAITFAALLVVLTFARPSPVQAAVEVNSCGQVIAGTALLTTDLDCSGTGTKALTIDRGNIYLQGHSIIGAQIVCTGSCRIYGPGTLDLDTALLVPPPSSAPELVGNRNLILADVSVVGAAYATRTLKITDSEVDVGLSSFKYVGSFVRSATIASSTIIGATIDSNGATRLKDSVVMQGRVRGVKIKVRNSSIDNAPGQAAVDAEKSAVVEDSVITNAAGNGVEATSYVGEGCVRTAGKVRVRNTTISGSGGYGVYAWRSASVRDSQVLGNADGGVFATEFRNECFLDLVGSVAVINSTVDGGVLGVYGYHVTTDTSSITGWEQLGIGAESLDATNTIVGTSNPDPACGVSQECPDVATQNKPQGSLTCDTSRELSFWFHFSPDLVHPEAWGVCASD